MARRNPGVMPMPTRAAIFRTAVALPLCMLPMLCIAAERSVTFLGETYTEASASTLAGAALHEFTRGGEGLDSWTRLLTIQCHPTASRMADVINPYLKARQGLFLSKPSFIRSPNDGDAGLVLIGVLGQSKATTFEFVVIRFSEQGTQGVIAASLSERHAAAKVVRIDDGKAIEDAIVNFDMGFARDVCSVHDQPPGLD